MHLGYIKQAEYVYKDLFVHFTIEFTNIESNINTIINLNASSFRDKYETELTLLCTANFILTQIDTTWYQTPDFTCSWLNETKTNAILE